MCLIDSCFSTSTEYSFLYFLLSAIDGGGVSRQLMSNVFSDLGRVKVTLRTIHHHDRIEIPLFDGEFSVCMPATADEMKRNLRRILGSTNEGGFQADEGRFQAVLQAVLDMVVKKASKLYEAIGRLFLQALSQDIPIPLQCMHPFLIQG